MNSLKELARTRPGVLAAAVVILVALVGWLIWASLLRGGGPSDLPPDAPAAGGRQPGPIGGMTPGGQASPGTLPGSGGR